MSSWYWYLFVIMVYEWFVAVIILRLMGRSDKEVVKFVIDAGLLKPLPTKGV